MPQINLDSITSRIGDDKVSCETLAAPATAAAAARKEIVADDPDLPPESFRVAIGDELEWVDVNAVYERDDSTKGSTNPKSQQQQQQQMQQQGHHHKAAVGTTTSQRFSGSLVPKAPIIGLPNKIQHHSGYIGHSARRPANGRIFPKKSPPGRKAAAAAAAAAAEPGSPKVSCFGKVRSDRERGRSGKVCDEAGGGCWDGFVALFRCGGGGGGGERGTYSCEEEMSRPATEGRAIRAAEAEAEAPGLGGMKRFASGRRAASWGGDMDGEVVGRGDVAWSGPLDGEERWARRSVGSLEDAERERHR